MAQQPPHLHTIQVAGAQVAERPVPKWVRAIKALTALAFFALIILVAFNLNSWRWVMDGFSPSFATWCAAIVTVAFAAALSLNHFKVVYRLLSVRKDENAKLIFFGPQESWRKLATFALCVGLILADLALVKLAVDTCPLPDRLAKLHINVSPPRPSEEGLTPIYFWDYATWIDPRWLDDVNIVLPYEKGPPQKFLSKVYFESAKTHSIELELHGKRPRNYAHADVRDVFESPAVQPRDWPLLFKLQTEAGLKTSSVLYLTSLDQGSSHPTQMIGIPWNQSSPNAGRVFFWGDDGSVFQARCDHPCKMSRALELVQFPTDPRGSHAERLEWTADFLRRLLSQPKINPGLLSIYLVSMLTQDPRDPEAFFHLGKLAKNRETAISAMKYGRDLGLEPAKIMELEAVANSLGK